MALGVGRVRMHSCWDVDSVMTINPIVRIHPVLDESQEHLLHE